MVALVRRFQAPPSFRRLPFFFAFKTASSSAVDGKALCRCRDPEQGTPHGLFPPPSTALALPPVASSSPHGRETAHGSHERAPFHRGCAQPSAFQHEPDDGASARPLLAACCLLRPSCSPPDSLLPQVARDEKTNCDLIELFNEILTHLNKQHDVDLREEQDDGRGFRWVEFLQLMRFQLPADM